MEPLGSQDLARIVSGGSIPLQDRLRDRLRQRIGDERYDLWFRKQVTFQWDAEHLVVGVVNRFFAEWIAKNFSSDLTAAARDALGVDLRIKLRVDPTLFPGPSGAANEAKLPSSSPPDRQAVPSPRLLYDIAPLPAEFDLNGTDHEIRSLKRHPELVRAVGELLIAWFHFGLGSGEQPCGGRDCRICGPQGYRRAMVGYFDSIGLRERHVCEPYSGSPLLECCRVVQCVPCAAANILKRQATIRGCLFQFQKPKQGGATKVRLLEDRCRYELAKPIDVREPLRMRYGLKEWPNQDLGGAGPQK